MILRQKSALDGFAYEFLDGTESLVVGGFHYAWFAQAKMPGCASSAPKMPPRGTFR